MTGVLLLYDEAMVDHDPGSIGHPERPQRLAAIRERLARPPEGVAWSAPRRAGREALERVHDAGYVRAVDALRGRSETLDVDTAVSPGSVEAAYLAAGAAVDAASAVARREAARAFAVVRPPGHHAERDRAMGFCLFNNVAVAAAHGVADLGCERVLIVDWDVHHGNGTQHIFEARRDVLYFSTHQHPLYPGTGAAGEAGAGAGEGFTVNVPMPAGLGDAEYRSVFHELLVPVAGAYRPDLVLVSAGFDAHADDPLGGMAVTAGGFASLCAVVCDLADRHAGGRLALVLEGGYDLDGLAASVAACVAVLAGSRPPEIPGEGPGRAEPVIDAVRSVHGRHWPL